MQFHHHGYVSGDPRVQPASGTGLDRPDDIPGTVDVLIVGTGPAGMITAAQLSQFSGVSTRIIDRQPGRLAIGRADGIQSRTVETFQAFGFADRIVSEAYRITETAFWRPDQANPGHIVRTARVADDPNGLSEFPHIVVNQARVLDYFAEVMEQSPTRMKPDYGYEFVSLEIDEDHDHPVLATIRRTDGPTAGQISTVRAKYVVGADGARSRVRESIGRSLVGDQANHAWGVVDVLAVTDFPDVRLKCAIQSASGGNILLIPREGGHLFRLYVDLGEVLPESQESIRATSVDEMIAKANEIMRPYRIDVKDVAWHSVYEVGHRLTDRFDDGDPGDADRHPRVFIMGDACHTHSAKAAQGMNVSMQDGFNLGWKLGHVLEGRSPEALLATYSEERHAIARDLIDFDKKWSSLMAARPEELARADELEDFYARTAEFPAGFMTKYGPSPIVGQPHHQHLATGFPLGRRFMSAPVVRVCDGNPIHLGHHARADGRWRIYVFGGRGDAQQSLVSLAHWFENSDMSPVARTPEHLDRDAWIDLKLVLPQTRESVDRQSLPSVFFPAVGPLGLTDFEKVYVRDEQDDVFVTRGIDPGGAVVVVRPDQYVAHVLPLSATDELGNFFAPVILNGTASGSTTGERT